MFKPTLDFPGAPATDWQVAEVVTGVADTPKAFSATQKLAKRAIVKAAADNTSDVDIGPNNSDVVETLSAGQEYLIEMPDVERFDLASWYATSAGATQTLSILYVY